MNVLEAQLVEWTEGQDGTMTLKLKIKDGMLLSQIIKRSFNDLALKSGLTVYAQIKSVALIKAQNS